MSDKVVEGEVVGGPRPARTYFHPYSGALILAVDWLAFGSEVVTGFTAVIAAAVFAAFVTFYGVLEIQTRKHGDSRSEAVVKALLGALAAGIPFPIGGTIVGGLILALSGLKR